ncbi:MAG: hypothetical protein JWL62_1608 [Hyphomicrobiales bacterium]|nr:hypothetical protein [Hyphomicrobiales bacterium]
MGRHRSAFKRALDLKPKVFRLSRWVTLGLPMLRRALSFFPEKGWPAAARVTIVHRSAYHYPWCAPAHAVELARVFEQNVDVSVDSSWPHFIRAERIVAILNDMIVPGHRVTPVDPITGRQISSDRSGPATWSTARPSISALTTHEVSGDLTIVIPRVDHFGHLLTDVLMPLFFAIQTIGFTQGHRLNVVTSERPVALVLAFINALRHAGYSVNHVETRTTQTILVPRLLYANCHTRNLELKFATPESLDFARTHLLAALPPFEGVLPKRIYLQRGRTRTRRVAGEAELIARLNGLGFVALEGRWSNLAQQIGAFHGADVVVSVHSAGMANMLWSRPGALLIEICAQNARKSTGLHWAACAGADYRSLFGSDEAGYQDFSIDPDAIFAEINDIIQSRENRPARAEQEQTAMAPERLVCATPG